MHWQIKTRVWGRIIPNAGWHIQNGHINRIYYIPSGKAYVQINQKTMQLIPGYLYLLPEGIRLPRGCQRMRLWIILILTLM